MVSRSICINSINTGGDVMKLDVVRFQMGADATNGLVFIDGKFECYSLEDEYREVKVMHETCIPEGEYDIIYRKVGGFHTKYSARYGAEHKGMLWLQDVPGFTYILIHSGNTDQHTSGCLIVGETQTDLDRTKDGFIGNSGDAYKKLYKKVSSALDKGEKVTIKYSNIADVLSSGNISASNKAGDEYISGKKVFEKITDLELKVSEVNGKLIQMLAESKNKYIR